MAESATFFCIGPDIGPIEHKNAWAFNTYGQNSLFGHRAKKKEIRRGQKDAHPGRE